MSAVAAVEPCAALSPRGAARAAAAADAPPVGAGAGGPREVAADKENDASRAAAGKDEGRRAELAKQQEATDRLIALALAEGDANSYNYGDYDNTWDRGGSSSGGGETDSGGEDYDPNKRHAGAAKTKKQKKKTAAKKGKKVSLETGTSKPAAEPVADVPSVRGERTPKKAVPKTTPAPAKTTPAPAKTKEAAASDGQRTASPSTLKTGKYLEDEENLFLEGLELCGRDWHKVADHMGHTREEQNIRSHAQTHFIRLFRDGKLLPAKVAESGCGYTLSGKPLDPESVSARRYLDDWDPNDEKNRAAIEANNRGSDGAAAKAPATLKASKAPGAVAKRRKKEFPVQTTENVQEVTPAAQDGSSAEPAAAAEEPVAASATGPPVGEESAAAGLTKRKEPPAAREDPSPVGPQVSATAGDADAHRSPPATRENKLQQKRARKEQAAAAATDSAADSATERKMRLRPRRTKPSELAFAELPSDLDPHSRIVCDHFSAPPNSGLPGAQPFKVEVSTGCFVVMDCHAHLRNAEIIGFLAGHWDQEAKCLKVLAAHPCKALSVHEDVINVEMDPEAADAVRAEIEERGLGVVGWYHSHPFFSPDPSNIDLVNQNNYQRLTRDDLGFAPFVGAIVTPFDPSLPSAKSVFNWFVTRSADPRKERPKRIIYELKHEDGMSTYMVDKLLNLIGDYTPLDNRTAMGSPWRALESQTVLEKLQASLMAHFVPGSLAPPFERVQADVPPFQVINSLSQRFKELGW